MTTSTPTVRDAVRIAGCVLAMFAVLGVFVFSPIILPICWIHDRIEDRKRQKRMAEARLWAC